MRREKLFSLGRLFLSIRGCKIPDSLLPNSRFKQKAPHSRLEQGRQRITAKKQRKAKRGGNRNHANGVVWLFIGSQRISAKEKRSPYHWESDLRNIKTIENRRV
jgi:hypothetical protein